MVMQKADNEKFFVILIIGGLLTLYLASKYITEWLGKTIDIGFTVFLVVLAMILLVLGYLTVKLMKKDVLHAEQWVMLIIIGVAITALFYFNIIPVPSGFSGAMIQAQSVLGG